MCVIIIKQQADQAIDHHIIRASARINPHGLGVTWLDTFQTEYLNSSDYEVLSINRPFIAHFRYATIGDINEHNMHPFVCGNNKDELLMMNGTIKGLGNKTDCDSRVLAHMLGDIDRADWKDVLEQHDCRFTTINTKTRTFEVYNESMWHTHKGVMYSKANVLFKHDIAVYGTLKKGHGNYHRFLAQAEFVGAGITQDKYPLLIDGLPYLLPEKGVGHRVEMHVFRVTDEMLQEIDHLEGHPNWYVRKRVAVHVGSDTFHAWTYFNPKKRTASDVMHSTFTSPKPTPWVYVDADIDETLPFEENEEGTYCLDCYGNVTKDESPFDTYTCTNCHSTFESHVLDQYKLF